MNPPKIERVSDGWSLRLRFGNGQRGRFLIALASEPAALQRAEQLSKLAARLARAELHAEAPIILRKGAEQTTAAGFASVEAFASELCSKAGSSAPARGLTFRELGEQWVSGELARRFPDHVKVKRERSVEGDRLRLARLCETIGDVPLSVFRLEDAERAMAALPGGRRPATRRHYGQIIARLLRLAVYPLRLIPSSPIPDGFLPKLGLRPAFPFLYPSEDAQLLACADVPLAMRLLYGFLTREGCRLSEALALRWRDFDLGRGVVTLGRTKTDNGRSWALSAGVAEALASCRGDADDEAAVFPPVNVDRAAELFRADLLVAGVKRVELHERTDARRPIRLHDARSTFITLALANGRTEAWVQDRSGHTTSAMLNRYRRAARFAAEVGLGALTPLNEALGLGQKVGQSSDDNDGSNTTKGEAKPMVDAQSEQASGGRLELCRRSVKNAGRQAADVSGLLRERRRAPRGWAARLLRHGGARRAPRSFWPAETGWRAEAGVAGGGTGCSRARRQPRLEATRRAGAAGWTGRWPGVVAAHAWGERAGRPARRAMARRRTAPELRGCPSAAGRGAPRGKPRALPGRRRARAGRRRGARGSRA